MIGSPGRRHEPGILLAVRLLRFANELVGFILRHLSTPHHVLNEVAGAFDGESGEAGRGVDDILHRSGHLAAGFQADLVGTGGHFGDRIANVLAAVTRASAGRCRGRGRFGTRIRLRLGYRRFFRHRGVPVLRVRRGPIVEIEESPVA